jgi:hypothetical protein
MLKTSILFACVVQLTFGLPQGQDAAEYYDYVSECPEENGFFADAIQCDRYYECQDGVVSEKLCKDGLVFDASSEKVAVCSFPFSINCTGRPELQPAQSVTKFCPRENGYFADPDPSVCDVFYFCVNGNPNRLTCPGGLVFDPSLGQCGWTHLVKREGCKAKNEFDFECPQEDIATSVPSRHLDEKSCTEFYLCISGTPRKSGCEDGLVYNDDLKACNRQTTLPEEDPCFNYYEQTYLDDVLPKFSVAKTLPNRAEVNRRRPQQDQNQGRRTQEQQEQTETDLDY